MTEVFLLHTPLGISQVQNFFASLKALSHAEIKYGTYATSEQVRHCVLVHKTTYTGFHFVVLFVIILKSFIQYISAHHFVILFVKILTSFIHYIYARV